MYGTTSSARPPPPHAPPHTANFAATAPQYNAASRVGEVHSAQVGWVARRSSGVEPSAFLSEISTPKPGSRPAQYVHGERNFPQSRGEQLGGMPPSVQPPMAASYKANTQSYMDPALGWPSKYPRLAYHDIHQPTQKAPSTVGRVGSDWQPSFQSSSAPLRRTSSPPPLPPRLDTPKPIPERPASGTWYRGSERSVPRHEVPQTDYPRKDQPHAWGSWSAQRGGEPRTRERLRPISPPRRHFTLEAHQGQMDYRDDAGRFHKSIEKAHSDAHKAFPSFATGRPPELSTEKPPPSADVPPERAERLRRHLAGETRGRGDRFSAQPLYRRADEPQHTDTAWRLEEQLREQRKHFLREREPPPQDFQFDHPLVRPPRNPLRQPLVPSYRPIEMPSRYPSRVGEHVYRHGGIVKQLPAELAEAVEEHLRRMEELRAASANRGLGKGVERPQTERPRFSRVREPPRPETRPQPRDTSGDEDRALHRVGGKREQEGLQPDGSSYPEVPPRFKANKALLTMLGTRGQKKKEKKKEDEERERFPRVQPPPRSHRPSFLPPEDDISARHPSMVGEGRERGRRRDAQKEKKKPTPSYSEPPIDRRKNTHVARTTGTRFSGEPQPKQTLQRVEQPPRSRSSHPSQQGRQRQGEQQEHVGQGEPSQSQQGGSRRGQQRDGSQKPNTRQRQDQHPQNQQANAGQAYGQQREGTQYDQQTQGAKQRNTWEGQNQYSQNQNTNNAQGQGQYNDESPQRSAGQRQGQRSQSQQRRNQQGQGQLGQMQDQQPQNQQKSAGQGRGQSRGRSPQRNTVLIQNQQYQNQQSNNATGRNLPNDGSQQRNANQAQNQQSQYLQANNTQGQIPSNDGSQQTIASQDQRQQGNNSQWQDQSNDGSNQRNANQGQNRQSQNRQANNTQGQSLSNDGSQQTIASQDQRQQGNNSQWQDQSNDGSNQRNANRGQNRQSQNRQANNTQGQSLSNDGSQQTIASQDQRQQGNNSQWQDQTNDGSYQRNASQGQNQQSQNRQANNTQGQSLSNDGPRQRFSGQGQNQQYQNQPGSRQGQNAQPNSGRGEFLPTQTPKRSRGDGSGERLAAPWAGFWDF